MDNKNTLEKLGKSILNLVCVTKSGDIPRTITTEHLTKEMIDGLIERGFELINSDGNQCVLGWGDALDGVLVSRFDVAGYDPVIFDDVITYCYDSICNMYKEVDTEFVNAVNVAKFVFNRAHIHKEIAERIGLTMGEHYNMQVVLGKLMPDYEPIVDEKQKAISINEIIDGTKEVKWLTYQGYELCNF